MSFYLTNQVVEVSCIFVKKRFASPDNSFVVADYRCTEPVEDVPFVFRAVGPYLPLKEDAKFRFRGRMVYNEKYRCPQLEVSSVQDLPTRAGVVNYLSSVKGIGVKTAENVFDTFGLDSLRVLEEEPDKLLAVKGISEANLARIKEYVAANAGDKVLRDLIVFLTPYNIATWQAKRFYEAHGERTMEVLRKHPYWLCKIRGIGFRTADNVAIAMGFDLLSPERIDAGLFHVMQEQENCGNCCVEASAFCNLALDLLTTKGMEPAMIGARINALLVSGDLAEYDGNIYVNRMEYQERMLAWSILRLAQCRGPYYNNLDSEVAYTSYRFGIEFADEQRQAIKMALTYGVSVITGGPGTGKTKILQAILDIYSRNYPGRTICCCAPTGRAARRMSQSTGHDASTIHKALNLNADSDYDNYEHIQLFQDLVLVDETSMLDVYLSSTLFQSIKTGAQVVLIGDVDQLPSVGPGAVLRDIIQSGRVPVTRLTKVFRQQERSLIVTNASKIRDGDRNVQYGPDFMFVESPDMAKSANEMIRLYVENVKLYGLDDVALLSPYRRKTETGVNDLNTRLRDMLNPASPDKAELSSGKRKYRVGDRVMQVKNYKKVNNGEIGYVTDIFEDGLDVNVTVEFDDARVVEYDAEHLAMLDWGYAMTIHKSQGSEYGTVICSVQNAHKIMLNRQLVYTAITRGKDRVVLVGEKDALDFAICHVDTQRRTTGLVVRLGE